MKTKPHLLLLAALSFGTASLHAGLTTDPLGICGGADDDQFRPPVSGGIVSHPLGLHGDDDSDTLSEFDALWNAVMTAPAPQMPPPVAPRPPVLQGLTTDPLSLTSDTLGRVPPPPKMSGIESDPFGLWGDNGTDSIYGEGGADSIVGGDGADFNNPAGRDRLEVFLLDYLIRRPDFIVQICGGNGNDSLWGGGGVDEIVADDTVDWYK